MPFEIPPAQMSRITTPEINKYTYLLKTNLLPFHPSTERLKNGNGTHLPAFAGRAFLLELFSRKRSASRWLKIVFRWSLHRTSFAYKSSSGSVPIFGSTAVLLFPLMPPSALLPNNAASDPALSGTTMRLP